MSISVSPSMKGADLESAESLGHYLVNEFVKPAIDCTRKVLKSPWYEKVGPDVRLKQISAALEMDLTELYWPLDHSMPTPSANTEETRDQKLARIDRQISLTGDLAFERIATANGTTPGIEREKLRQRYIATM